jgi:hypothetical protein
VIQNHPIICHCINFLAGKASVNKEASVIYEVLQNTYMSIILTSEGHTASKVQQNNRYIIAYSPMARNVPDIPGSLTEWCGII